jgi:hypothetical protein
MDSTPQCPNKKEIYRINQDTFEKTEAQLVYRRTGVLFLAGARHFSFHQIVQTGYGAHPASYTMSNGTFPPEVKWPGREADHSPPLSADTKNVGAILVLHIYLHVMVLN